MALPVTDSLRMAERSVMLSQLPARTERPSLTHSYLTSGKVREEK